MKLNNDEIELLKHIFNTYENLVDTIKKVENYKFSLCDSDLYNSLKNKLVNEKQN